MDLNGLKKSITYILAFWGIIFWLGGIGYMVYTGTSFYMWGVMAAVLIVPIIILYFIFRTKMVEPKMAEKSQ